jgi:FlaA1/EpsC-like NDP-sugar epimerase
MAAKSEIYVLDMGKPVKILDLAENMIRLSGFTPYVDIDIDVIGLRPGEKLYEELLMGEEGLARTSNDLIYIGKKTELDPEVLAQGLAQLRELEEGQENLLRSQLRRIVPTYHPSGETARV